MVASLERVAWQTASLITMIRPSKVALEAELTARFTNTIANSETGRTLHAVQITERTFGTIRNFARYTYSRFQKSRITICANFRIDCRARFTSAAAFDYVSIDIVAESVC
jgi:hypothetical protein